MTDILCPLCGKPNPPDLDECKYCQAPLKTTGFFALSDQEGEKGQSLPPPGEPGKVGDQSVQPEPTSPFDEGIPDWLKQTEANFLEGTEAKPEQAIPDDLSMQLDSLLNQPSTPEDTVNPVIDDDWLASLLAEAGAGSSTAVIPPEGPQGGQVEDIDKGEAHPFIEEPIKVEGLLPPNQPEKPDWLTGLEAASTIKLAGGLSPSEPIDKSSGISEPGEAEGPVQADVPEWVGKVEGEEIPPGSNESETPIAPAELPSWLEALRPEDTVSPTGPIEDLSAADVVTAGPLVGLRGVISAHPSAIRARKPPTYSIKLRVTDEQRARVEMMEALLADEQKPKPLPSQPIITSRNIFRLVIAAVLIVPIVWMIVTGSQKTSPPQPGSIPGVLDFTQQVQTLPAGIPVLLAFDYEAGFSGEMNLAVSTLINQLMIKNAYLTLVTTTPSGPALAESIIKTSSGLDGMPKAYSSYTNLGYLPGGTMGLLGLAISPKSVLPYSLDGVNVWAIPPLNTVLTITDFSAVIVMTNDPDIARSWIEQVGPVLRQDGTPLLIITSSQAEPLIRPYVEATPSQVQGLVSGLAGGLAYSRTVGTANQNGVWDAYSISMTTSALIIIVGSIIGVVLKMPTSDKKKEG
jgi:hypothetical protein